MAEDLQIVLLGKTGSGKSATGNTILGKYAFDVGSFSESTTKLCEKQILKVEDKNISVIDTPGLFHTSITEENVLKTEIEKCLKMSSHGPHVFLIVIRLGRLTEEEKSTVKWIQKNFGQEMKRFTMMLFTGADKLDKPIEEFLQNNLKYLDECMAEYHVLTNVKNDDQSQVPELLNKINTMVENNGGQWYTQEMYQEAQTKIREEEEKKTLEDTSQKTEEERNSGKEKESGNMHIYLLGVMGLAFGFCLYNYGKNYMRCH